MTAAANKQLVRDMIDRLFNEGHEDVIDECFSPELATVLREHYLELTGAFSGLHVEVLDMLAEGDRVAARLVVSGVHDGDAFAGQPSSGASVRYQSFRFYRVDGGLVVETWALQDRLGLLHQLGAVDGFTSVEWAGEAGPPQR